MKKILLPLCALAFTVANVSAEKQLVKQTNWGVTLDESGAESARTDNGGTTYYYDKNNNLVLEALAGGYTQYSYTYTADGKLDKKFNQSWSQSNGWETSGYTKNVYDAEGNLLRAETYNLKDSLMSVNEYSGYVNGCYAKMENKYGNGEVYYSQTYGYTWNENNQPLTMTSYSGEFETANQMTTYTYNANGQLETESTQYSDGTGGWMDPHMTNTYYYNTDGNIDHVWQYQNGRWGVFVTDAVYTYADLDAAYVPTITSIEAGEANTVKLAWTAVEGATAYKVIFDQTVAEVTETTFTTSTLLDGSHNFYVLAVVNGEDKNVSDVATCSVKDEGKKPATDFAMGAITLGENDWGGVAYNIEVSWTLPTNASPITGIKVYYGESSYDYVSVADVTATSATIQLGEYAVRVYDTELYEYTDGKDLTFSVVISYATGDSERSNTVTCNPHNIATDIQTVVANGATENADVYTVSGICVRKNVKTADAVNGLAKGIYVIKSGKATQKVTVK